MCNFISSYENKIENENQFVRNMQNSNQNILAVKQKRRRFTSKQFPCNWEHFTENTIKDRLFPNGNKQFFSQDDALESKQRHGSKWCNRLVNCLGYKHPSNEMRSLSRSHRIAKHTEQLRLQK